MKMNELNSAYTAAPLMHRALVAARPYICPFEPVLAEVPSGQEILDVGCGVGALLTALALQGKVKSGVGVDINPKSIEVANRVARSIAMPQLSFQVADSAGVLPGLEYDVVTLIDVMHHIPPLVQRQFFMNCAERVRPGGLLVYKDMADEPIFYNLFNRLHDLVLARQFIHYAPLESVVMWAGECGLSPVSKSLYSRLAYAHELVVFRKDGGFQSPEPISQ